MKTLLILVMLFGTAHAKMWASSLGKLMTRATSVELVDVDSLDGTTMHGKLVEGFRSKRAPGERVEFDLGSFSDPVRVGDSVLVICDSECPRAIGVERAGWFELAAEEPGDGAFLFPTRVSHLALPALVAGKPAPSLCIEGTVEFAEETVARPLKVAVSASEGAGKGTLGGVAVNARFDGNFVRVFGARESDEIELMSAAIAPTKGSRCLGGTFAPIDDGPRTFVTATRLLAGKLGALVFARGMLDKHSMTLAMDGGNLVLTSDLATGRSDSRSGHDEIETFEFPSGKTHLRLELATNGHGLISTFATRKSIDVHVSRIDGGQELKLGVARMTYVKPP